MICQNYESVPVPYRTFAEISDDGWHGELPYPYAERLYESLAPQGLSVSGDTVSMSGWTATTAYPGWSMVRWIFNAVTGAFVGYGTFLGVVGWSSAKEVYEGAAGDFFMQVSGGAVYKYDPVTGAVDEDSVIYPSRYDRTIINAPMWDTALDRVVMGGELSVPLIHVYELASGTLLKTINVPNGVKETVYAGATRVYALLVDGSLLGLDYATGEVFQHTKTPIDVSVDVHIAWSRKYRRLLACSYSPDNVDGTATTVIKGYRNIPVAVHVCKPIPLKRLRVGVTTPVLVKQIGDLGEGLPGALTVEGGTTVALITRTVVATDGDGEATTDVIGGEEGTDTITVSAETACLL